MLRGITVNKNLEPFQKIVDQEIVGVATWLLTVRSFHKERKQQREKSQRRKPQNHVATPTPVESRLASSLE